FLIASPHLSTVRQKIFPCFLHDFVIARKSIPKIVHIFMDVIGIDLQSIDALYKLFIFMISQKSNGIESSMITGLRQRVMEYITQFGLQYTECLFSVSCLIKQACLKILIEGILFQ